MPKLYKPLSIIFLFFTVSAVFSQDNVDSLKTVFKTAKEDTIRFTTIGRLLVNIHPQDPEFAKYMEQIKVIADKNLSKKSITNNDKIYWKNAMGKYFLHKSELTYNTDQKQAILLINRAINTFTEVKNTSQMAEAYVSRGILERRMGKLPEAVKSYYKGLNFFEQIKDKDGIAYAQMSIAKVYMDQKKDDQAVALNKKALAYFETIKKPTMQDIGTKAELNHTLGQIAMSHKNYKMSESYFDVSFNLAKGIDYQMLMSVVLVKIGRINFEQNKFDIAYQKFQQALKLEQPDLYRANIYNSMGELRMAQENYTEAEQYFNKALAIGKEKGSIDIQLFATKFLSQLYKKTKSFEKALASFELFKQFQDSVKVSESRNILKEQQLQYEFGQKELTYKLDNEKKTAAKNNWLIALSGLLLLILLGGYFYYRNNKQRQSIAALEKNQIKQKLLITQMNPHFIFNSIENIRSLIYASQNNLAVEYLTKFSKLTRQILENSNENYISLMEEIEMTENYLSIQQLLYNNKFDFKIAVEKDIDTEAIFLPPMLTQPFIENAIKHGLSNTTENGRVDIRFYLREAKLFFEVSDNGKGFDNSQKSSGHKSLAMTITKERLVTYSKNLDFVVHADNITNENHKIVGAKIIFEIPYIYEN